MRPRTPARGCAGALFFAGAFFLILVSFSFTVEMETYPGLRDNLAPAAVWACGIAVVLAVGALAATGWRSVGGLVTALVVVLLVALRMYTVAPMLHCWSYDSVGRDSDGTYGCYNR